MISSSAPPNRFPCTTRFRKHISCFYSIVCADWIITIKCDSIRCSRTWWPRSTPTATAPCLWTSGWREAWTTFPCWCCWVWRCFQSSMFIFSLNAQPWTYFIFTTHGGKTYFYSSSETPRASACRSSVLRLLPSLQGPFCRLSVTGCGNVITSHAGSAPSECSSVFHLLGTICAHIYGSACISSQKPKAGALKT